ncbi:hypothetical protein R1flu_003949 [Riccia fluitans]|uniref:Uncharacterized protein n=1 Tax=Riccia fluitans TaxID=41844 RepID=A0ABD1YPQ6_9MARC
MNRKPGYGAQLRANPDPTKGVDRLRQQDGGHGSRNPLRRPSGRQSVARLAASGAPRRPLKIRRSEYSPRPAHEELEMHKCWGKKRQVLEGIGLRYSRNAPGVGYKRARSVGLDSRVALDPERRKCWLESRVEMRQVMEKDPSVGQSGPVRGVALFYSRLALPGPCRVLDDQVALLARLLNLHAEPKEVPLDRERVAGFE